MKAHAGSVMINGKQITYSIVGQYPDYSATIVLPNATIEQKFGDDAEAAKWVQSRVTREARTNEIDRD